MDLQPLIDQRKAEANAAIIRLSQEAESLAESQGPQLTAKEKSLIKLGVSYAIEKHAEYLGKVEMEGDQQAGKECGNDAITALGS